jgi:hypothetical protein
VKMGYSSSRQEDKISKDAWEWRCEVMAEREDVLEEGEGAVKVMVRSGWCIWRCVERCKGRDCRARTTEGEM